MRLTVKELEAINDALSELLAGDNPQGVVDPQEAADIFDAAHAAQQKIQKEIARRKTRTI